LTNPGPRRGPPNSRVGAASGLLRCIRFKSKAAAAGTERGTHLLRGSGWGGQAMAKLGLGRARTGAVPQIVWRGSLQKRKRHQTAGAEDADNGPNHVGPRGIVAVLRSRFVSDRHFFGSRLLPTLYRPRTALGLCSFVLRRAGSEPLCERSAPAPLGRPRSVVAVPAFERTLPENCSGMLLATNATERLGRCD
jgi:hypothetical protein